MDEDDEVSHLREEISKVMDKFMEAINLIGSSSGLDKMIEDCFDAYNQAISGRKSAGKFCKKWKQILSTKVGVLELLLPTLRRVKLNY